MSELAKTARAAMREKAQRLVGGMHGGAGPGTDPAKKIDLSGWSEPTDMNTTAPTGMRPVSRRQFKDGGHVSGEHTKHRADRKARKAGGKVDAWVNRDVRSANHEIAQPHIGGFAHGGATKNFREQMGCKARLPRRSGGGNWIAGAIKHPGALHREIHVPEGERIPAKKLKKAAHSDNPKLAHRANLAKTLKRMHHAKGGKVSDEAEDKKMIAAAVHKHEHHDHKGEPLTKLKKGGRAHKASGGSTGYADIAGMRPKGDRIPRKAGGKAKGKTQIIIGIHAGGAHPQAPMAPGAMPVKPPMPPPPSPPMVPPQGMPGMNPAMGATMPGLGMPRASGGKVVGAKYGDASIAKAEKVKSPKQIPAGGGGLGRLAKRSIAQKDGFHAE